MKMTIQNLGRIKAAEIDLRPLTVFVGPNGTNKTWTAYAAYSLLRELSWFAPRGTAPEALVLAERVRHEARAVARARMSGVTLDTGTRLSVEFARREFAGAFANGVQLRGDGKHLSRWIRGAGEAIENAGVTIALDEADLLGDPEAMLKVTVSGNQGSETEINSWGGLALTRVEGSSLKTPVEILEKEAEIFALAPLAAVIMMPAERKALEPWNRPLQLLGVLKDAWRALLLASDLIPERPLGELVDRFTSAALGGRIENEEVNGRARFSFVTREGLKLPMASAASLAGAVTSLCLVLSRLARPGDILVIDELELHAHPDAQLALIELVAAAVNEGIRVILTTHSPYIVDHLNTLLEAGRADEAHQDKLAEQFVLRTRKAFLAADKVSVYSFQATKDGSAVEVKSAIDKETGLVVDSTFAPVTTRLSRLFNAALDAVEQSS